MDYENVDIYPVGWADLVGHKLEGPRQQRKLISFSTWKSIDFVDVMWTLKKNLRSINASILQSL